MTTVLTLSATNDNSKTYINPLKRDTPAGEVLKVKVWFDHAGTVIQYDVTKQGEHRFLGNTEESMKELPSYITLND